jgi:Chaperone of endosialidase
VYGVNPLAVVPQTAASGAPTAVTVTGAANTNQTASTETPDVYFNLARTVQWATGALTTQRAVLITPPTLTFVGASTVTNAATLGISGAPVLGTNATVTNTHGLLISAGAVGAAAHSYGLTANAQTGATNNYAAVFLGGEVGIKTASPAQALEVNGQVKVDTFAAASATTVCQNANVLSTCSSSIRYKENVKDGWFGLKEVLRMRPVTFKWKGRDENDLGFIAEEVEKINPLFVSYARGQIEGVKYPQLTAVIVNAVKERQNQMDRQQMEIDSLTALNDKLQAV